MQNLHNSKIKNSTFNKKSPWLLCIQISQLNCSTLNKGAFFLLKLLKLIQNKNYKLEYELVSVTCFSWLPTLIWACGGSCKLSFQTATCYRGLLWCTWTPLISSHSTPVMLLVVIFLLNERALGVTQSLNASFTV